MGIFMFVLIIPKAISNLLARLKGCMQDRSDVTERYVLI